MVERIASNDKVIGSTPMLKAKTPLARLVQTSLLVLATFLIPTPSMADTPKPVLLIGGIEFNEPLYGTGTMDVLTPTPTEPNYHFPNIEILDGYIDVPGAKYRSNHKCPLGWRVAP